MSSTGAEPTERKVAIKFLVANSLAGGLIGTGGKCIKDLIEVSGARINISGANDFYPGSSDRVVLISGSVNTVAIAQTLVWEMLALLAKSGKAAQKEVVWNPKEAFEALGTNDDVVVSAKITIPAAAGGQILGKNGATIRSITEESGAKISMSSKEEALFTQERIITLTGEAGRCVKATDLILSKLAEQEEIPLFVNRGTTYTSPLDTSFGLAAAPANARGTRTGPKSAERKIEGKSTEESVSDTTITLSIPNELVGNIFGKNGSTMREIISLSGAKVVVSPRDELVEGTSNRLVTITGTPAAAQTAHIFITQRLRNPTNPPRRARA